MSAAFSDSRAPPGSRFDGHRAVIKYSTKPKDLALKPPRTFRWPLLPIFLKSSMRFALLFLAIPALLTLLELLLTFLLAEKASSISWFSRGFQDGSFVLRLQRLHRRY